MRGLIGPLCLAACAGALGCSTDALHYLPLPQTSELEQARSIVAQVSNEGQLTFDAFDLEQDPAITATGQSVTLLIYDLSLQEMGLEQGPIEPGSLDCRLARPLVAFEVDLTVKEDAIGWLETDENPILDTLLPDRNERCPRCRQITVKQVDLSELEIPGEPESSRPIVGGFLEDGRAMVIREIGGIFAIDRNGGIAPISGCEDPHYFAIHPVDGRQFWVGRFAALDLIEVDSSSDTCRVVTSTTVSNLRGPPSQITSFAGRLDPADPDVVMSFTTGLFKRLRKDRIEDIAELPFREGEVEAYYGSVTPLESGEIALTTGSQELAFYSDNKPLRIETLEIPAFGRTAGIEGVAQIAGLGLVIGTSVGEIFRYDSGGFSDMNADFFAQSVGAIAAYRDGFIASTKGFVMEYQPGTGFCEAVAVPGSIKPGRRMIVQGEVGFIPQLASPENRHAASSAWLFLE